MKNHPVHLITPTKRSASIKERQQQQQGLRMRATPIIPKMTRSFLPPSFALFISPSINFRFRMMLYIYIYIYTARRVRTGEYRKSPIMEYERA